MGKKRQLETVAPAPRYPGMITIWLATRSGALTLAWGLPDEDGE